MVAIPEAIVVCFIDLLMSLYKRIRQPASKCGICQQPYSDSLSIDDLITITASISCGPKAKVLNTPMWEVENEITINVPHGENGLHASKTNKGQAH